MLSQVARDAAADRTLPEKDGCLHPFDGLILISLVQYIPEIRAQQIRTCELESVGTVEFDAIKRCKLFNVLY